ncbi:MAG: ABC-2 family transporter protein [Myxococcales bacterium]|nr:ABC-2 family transporter protein [Myxococcota bacterium]MDW8280861.1 ABC-2 family transporter protein [Myxococcales bacterium]
MEIRRNLRAYPTLLRIGIAEAVAYRAELIVWMLTTTLPLVSMVLWRAVAAEGPIGPERFSAGDFTAYFLLALLVRLLTSSWVLWEMNREIRTGIMSQRLLRPVHPLVAYSAENLAATPLRALLVLPVSLLLLYLYGRSEITKDPLLVGAFVLSLPGAWALTFLSMVLCGCLAFYIESSLGIFHLWYTTYVLCSGYLVPLSLLPGPVRALAEVLPFRYMLDFPVRLLLGLPGLQGSAAHAAVLSHLVVEYAYVAGLLIAVALLWRAGLRRYAAFGA